MAEFRFSVCSELFKTVSQMSSFDETINAIKSLDADIELAPFTEDMPVTSISGEEVLRRRKYLEDSGVRVSGVHWILAGGDKVFNGDWVIEGGPHIACREGLRRQKTANYAAKVFEYVTYLRGAENVIDNNPLVGVWGSPGQRNIHPNTRLENAIEYASRTFARILNQGEHCVTIALERLVHNRFPNGKRNPNGETSFCYTMNQVDLVVGVTRNKLKKTVNPYRMRSMLDTKAAVLSDDNPLKVLDDPCMIYHVHVQDPYSLGPPGWNSKGEFLGAGYYDFKPLMYKLVEINRGGEYVCVSMEPFKPFFDKLPEGVKGRVTPEAAFRESLGYLRGIVRKCQVFG